MNLFIRQIKNGAEYEERIFDFWIAGQLGDSLEVTVFDSVPFDLRSSVMKNVECLIVAGFLENITVNNISNQAKVTGTFVSKYNIENTWSRLRHDTQEKQWSALQTEYGDFLLYTSEMEKLNINNGSRISFDVGRFDLVGVKL